MSFFQDIPPPLDDDKARDLEEYDLEEENSSRISTEFPENLNIDVTHLKSSFKPPELSSALFYDEPPPDDDFEPSKVSRDDSFEEFIIYDQHSNESEVMSPLEDSKLSQLENVDKSSSISDNGQEHGVSILSPNEPNRTEVVNEPQEVAAINQNLKNESDNEIISSFSTSLTCNSYNTNENLHNMLTEDDNCDKTHDVKEDINLEFIIEDDNDEFSDFEAAIPINNRTVEIQATPTVLETSFQEEVKFEADFSSFNDHNENFDDDFNDFESAPIEFAQETHSIEFVKPSNVKTLVDEMFPTIQLLEEAYNDVHADNTIRNDVIVKKLDDLDATLALGFLYSNSTASQTLVKALGIDTRNILLGPQWASSMPRFAANLSFNPLEPLKPMSESINNKSDLKNAKISATSKPDVVPEVQFDWISSGLVNPLDGKQPNTQHSNEPKVQSTAVFKSASPVTVVSQQPSDPTSHAVDEKEMTQSEAIEANIGTDLDSHLTKFSSWETPSFQAATNSILVRERTIKLPETHIFTPVKSTSPVAREVKSRDGSPSNTIVVKEYHDIEYLEPKRKIETENDFDDFQSAFVEPPTSSLMPSSLGILEPLKVENQKNNTIAWPNPGEILEDFSFIENTDESSSHASKIKETKPISIKELPVIGHSPSKQQLSENDEFAEFQAAPDVSMPNLKPQIYQNSLENIQKGGKKIENKSNEPLTLSPSKLVSTMNKPQKSTWINSMDDDEVNRIEAAFPKCKVSPKPQPKTNDVDEEEWSDFVGVSSSSQNVLNHQKPFNDDNWSDFVSAPPPPLATVNSISSQILSKPNFTSWNQPVAKPYVHHATSFLSSETKNYNSTSYQSEMTITNNFNYQPNRISTILPDLDFAMPRNLINLPRNESSGKK